MLMAVDIGNTNVTIGAFSGPNLIRQWRLSTDATRTRDEYRALFNLLLSESGQDIGPFTAAIICSVVPPLNDLFSSLCLAVTGTAPLMVTPGLVGMAIPRYRQEQLGMDRLVNSAAAYGRTGGPLIVVDFGTTTTFDVVSANGEYLGGAITPGLHLGGETLCRNAARLPHVSIPQAPGAAIGEDTAQSIQSGLFWGYVAMVDGLVERLEGELGQPCQTIATGGTAALVVPHSRRLADRVVPDLTLEGLHSIYSRAAATASA